MEQKQISLETIYEMLKRIEGEVEMINNRLDWRDQFTEEENEEFIKGTEVSWKEVDEGKYTTYSSPEEIVS